MRSLLSTVFKTTVLKTTVFKTTFPMIVGLMIVACNHQAVQGQDRKFPYQAIVETDGEYVRSGPGPSFYPTDKLRKGEKVTVHRHDPGGWCMISPPPGSFSWIRAGHVQRSGESGGVLKANNVVVHVGSSLSADEFTTIQGNLSKGDAVQILGEKTFPFEDGPKLMYKISPVRREWRWIQRKSIVAADAIQSDPFPGETAPSKKPGPVADQIQLDPDAFAQPISTGESVTGPGAGNSSPRSQQPRVTIGQPATTNTESNGFPDRLDAVDAQFREMIKQDPAAWNLKEIGQKYSQLDNEASLPNQSKAIGLRLDAVGRYEKTQQEYLRFLKISEEARQRDALLAQQQREAELRAGGGAPDNTAPTAQPGPPTNPQPQPAGGTPIASTGNVGAGDVPPPANPANAQRFAGAGVVVAMAQTFPGGPQYALVAPGGKLLAYLIPTAGVDLRRSVNQSMGISGDRSFKQEWGADAIVVRGLQPVQLRASR
jgi:hypothetical protein